MHGLEIGNLATSLPFSLREANEKSYESNESNTANDDAALGSRSS